MIYMKSNSANDGSYSLGVSFDLGTNADVDTVNVNNRVQAALPRLPADVQHQGVTVRKRSTAILEFLQVYSETGEQTPLFISNYVTINVLDRLARTPGVGDATLFGRLDYAMRIWFDMTASSPWAWRRPISSTRSSNRMCRPRRGGSARGRRRTARSFS